ncbi:MAG: VCBS repeat-containing protein [Bacteroidales bacterium]|nr:VCBS repeat-containing protein [Bacteroidales bacterium]
MKTLYSYLLIGIFSLFLINCTNNEEKQKKKSLELISARTVGLAYLEENKLDEAEQEFLKFIKLAPKEKLGYANLGLVYLRMGKYKEAEKILKKAIKIDPEDPDVRLIIATVYEMADDKEKAIEQLKESLKYSPTHIKTLYNLSELFSNQTDTSYQKQREFYLLKIVENDPANLVPRLSLTEIFIRNGKAEPALEQLEEIVKLFPEFPREAEEYYDRCLDILQQGDYEKAITPFIIFHNYLKVTSPYQAGIMDLKGPGGSLIGFPVITFDQQVLSDENKPVSILENMSFTDITASAGLDVINQISENTTPGLTHVSVNDYDSDGDIDLYAGTFDVKSSTYRHYLFTSDMGKFFDVAKDAGIRHSGNELGSKFDDYDNDGYPDLFIITEGNNILYRNNGKGEFEDVSRKANLDIQTGGNKALFFDIDHDGDLDLFLPKAGPNVLFRNNGDGTFGEQAGKMFIDGGNTISRDAAFGDFDEDGDIDLFVINQDAKNALYFNQRQDQFKNSIEESGLENNTHSSAVAVGDYNNDGFLDFFIGTSEGGNQKLYINAGEGKFTKDEKSGEIFKELKNVSVYDAEFIDFDNDGALDLLVVGESSEKDGNGVFLFHNNGIDNYDDVSYLLPEDLKSGRQITTFDYNVDGDVDILIAGFNGTVRLLRNDGGNLNHFVKIKLVGLRTGSAKNNYYGIGAKVEMRSGDLYQTKVVTDPNVIFGLGSRQKSDIIRITWTNGVPQNIFFPGSDQSIIEAQVLKGSCPFLYTWNGSEYVLAKDILWRSALGMPLGIMGGTTTYGFPEASDDYYKIPGELLQPKDGKYSLKVTAELWETIYMDKIRLIAVDHPDSVDVYVDERFSPPPFPYFDVYVTGKKYFPVSATDDKGNDLLPYIIEKDDNYISNFKLGKYQGITVPKDLILDLGKVKPADNLYLFLNGWVFPTDASINFALSQSSELKSEMPVIQVVNKNGEWETVIRDLSFPMGKNKTIVVKLGNKFLSADRCIRIRTNMQIYWDLIFYAYTDINKHLLTNELKPETADLQYRGFSAEFRKGGRYGPHWFDYTKVSEDKKWRDLTGMYTRFGDVLPLLDKPDSKYVIMNAGDEISLEFSTDKLPVLKDGWKRDFMIYNVGWVKDGDLNTATGQTVEPLPFHGMSCYPYGPDESYPNDTEHQEYLREYNTREVTNAELINALKK